MRRNEASLACASAFSACFLQVANAALIRSKPSGHAALLHPLHDEHEGGYKKNRSHLIFARNVTSLRHFGDGADGSDEKDWEEWWDSKIWHAKSERISSRRGMAEEFRCGKPILVHSDMNPEERCPLECPFLVQDKSDDAWCSFRCVVKEECTEFNPKTPIADMDQGICRAPDVYACKEPMTNGEDACKVCNDYYFLVMGGCIWVWAWAAWLGVLASLVIMALVLLWVLDLAVRPTTNFSMLRTAMVFRSRQKLHQPMEHCNERLRPWPVWTNMHKKL